MNIQARVYRELPAGEYSRHCCTTTFYSRVNALLQADSVIVDLGAGRGAQIAEETVPYRRYLKTFKGRCARVVGIDIDKAVLENPFIDEARLFEAGGAFPLETGSADMIVSDHVLEHIADPGPFAAEVRRVLKPGGWFCARTPAKWGYIGLGARVIPNSLHVRLLKNLQPERKDLDVFPTTYRLNTLGDLKRHFPAGAWRNCTYGWNGVPGYHANRMVLFRAIQLWSALMPEPLSAKYHVFMQRL